MEELQAPELLWLTLAQEAQELREEQRRIADRLVEIAADLHRAGPQEWVANGSKYRVRTQVKKTFTVQPDKLQLAEPDVYRRVVVEKVDNALLKAEIAKGRAVHWARYAEWKESAPFVDVSREEME